MVSAEKEWEIRTFPRGRRMICPLTARSQMPVISTAAAGTTYAALAPRNSPKARGRSTPRRTSQRKSADRANPATARTAVAGRKLERDPLRTGRLVGEGSDRPLFEQVSAKVHHEIGRADGVRGLPERQEPPELLQVASVAEQAHQRSPGPRLIYMLGKPLAQLELDPHVVGHQDAELARALLGHQGDRLRGRLIQLLAEGDGRPLAEVPRVGPRSEE